MTAAIPRLQMHRNACVTVPHPKPEIPNAKALWHAEAIEVAREAYKAGLEETRRMRPVGEGRYEDRRMDRRMERAPRDQAPVLPGDRLCPACGFHNFKGKYGAWATFRGPLSWLCPGSAGFGCPG